MWTWLTAWGRRQITSLLYTSCPSSCLFLLTDHFDILSCTLLAHPLKIDTMVEYASINGAQLAYRLLGPDNAPLIITLHGGRGFGEFFSAVMIEK